MKLFLSLCSLPVSLSLLLGISCADSTTGTATPAVQTSAPAPAQDDAKPMKQEVKATKAKQVDDDTAVKAVRAFIEESEIDKSIPQWKRQLRMPKKVAFDAKHNYFWNLQTNKGPIKIQFMPDVAPMHVTSTMYLTEVGFYDGLAFHRVIQGFMAQGGCPIGNGTGNPGYGYDGEFDPKVRHDRPGLLSMANTGRPGSDGSQFFLTFVPTPHLDGNYTVFGQVVRGLEAVDALEVGDRIERARVR